MHEETESRYLSTQEAAKAVGYTHDYVARMCREGKMRGERVGQAWMIEEKELARFVRAHGERLKEYRASVSRARKAEQIVEKREARPQTLYTRGRPPRLRRVLQEAFAIVAAVVVVGSAITFAESGLFESMARETRTTTLEAASGFSYLAEASFSRIEATARAAPYIPEGARLASYQAPTLQVRVPALPESDAFSFTPVFAHKARRERSERPLAVPRVGDVGIRVGAAIRDYVRFAPQPLTSRAVVLGEYFTGVSHSIMVAHERSIYAFVELPEPIARATIGGFLEVGKEARLHAAALPRTLLGVYGAGVRTLATRAPLVLHRAVEAELAFGTFLQEASANTARMALEPVVRTVAYAPLVVDGALYLKEEAEEISPRLSDSMRVASEAARSFLARVDVASVASVALSSAYKPVYDALGSLRGAIAFITGNADSVVATDEFAPYTPPIGASSSSIEENGRELITEPRRGEYRWSESVNVSGEGNPRRDRAVLGIQELERAALDGAYLRRLDGSALRIDPLSTQIEKENEERHSGSWLADTVDLITGAMDKENAERICIEDRCYTKDDVMRLLKQADDAAEKY